MTTPGEHDELGPNKHEGDLGPGAAAMRDLPVSSPEQAAPPEAPSVGEFYRDLADSSEVRNPTMRHLLAQAAEANLETGRIWQGEDEAPAPNVHGHAAISEGMARQTIGGAVEDAGKWLDVYERGVRTTDVARGSRTLLDLHGGDDFDRGLLTQFSKIVGMDPEAEVPAVPDSGSHAQPDRFATRLYPTRIRGVQVRAWSHRRDGGSIWQDHPGGTLRPDNWTKFSFVPAENTAERADNPR